ncbi:Hypothetical_protein [Hexamita inflata]|uniref:Hypothetical_protein n=1 Tax=Hexamita inflata TaxID=28002 RepID=A0AA86P070_9EUKA|nr:Hypothetical protein HINF_LOCUS16253 [Hexamita inflata]
MTFVKKQNYGAHADSKLFANFPPHYVRKSPNLRDDRQIFLNIAFTGTRNADIKDANNAFYGFKNTGGCSLTRKAPTAGCLSEQVVTISICVNIVTWAVILERALDSCQIQI